MKKMRCLLIALASFAALPALANSSWIWISETRPYDVLPWVAAGTILMELAALRFFGKAKITPRGVAAVILANLLSFAAPYILYYLSMVSDIAGGMMYEYLDYLDYFPSYIVGSGFALVTILVELPVVYAAFHRSAVNGRRLFCAVVLANLLSTAFVAVTERLLCRGGMVTSAADRAACA